MKVSVNWIKEFTKVDLPIDQLVEKIGAQLGAVDGVENLGERYQGIVVVKVASCQPIPDTDKLTVCKVDDAKAVEGVVRDAQGLVEVVCGAPNVREGMLAVWIPPGATVPSSIGQKGELVLDAREIRGVVSNGMLASASELAIGEDHNGIVVLGADEGAKPGDSITNVLKLDDHVIDIENKMFTHRPDLFGILGVAREIAGITGNKFSSPAIYKDSKDVGGTQGSLDIEVMVETPDLVPRFIAQVFENVTVKQSPLWLKSYLSRLGIRPINNIVDITNYMMLLTAQPMHAYDYDKVRAGKEKASIIVRKPKKGEKLTLLSGKDLEPTPDDIMIASERQLIGLGGVMGGGDTEVDDSTKNIILECASFDMYSTRRTAMAHGLFTDAVTRFTKGQSALQNDRVVAWASEHITRESGATPGKRSDVKKGLKENKPVKVKAEFINARLGESLSAQEMAKLLSNVEFNVAISGDELTVTPPFWRTDIEIAEDIVEEVGRLYGYDHLPVVLPLRTNTPAPQDELLAIKSKIRQALSSAGANEVLSYSFIHEELMRKVGQDKNSAFQIANALSPDLQYYRLSLMPSLLEKIHPNVKQGYSEFGLFEINPVHAKDFVDTARLPIEDQRLAFVFTAVDKTVMQKYAGAPFYQAKKYLLNLLAGLGISVPSIIFEPAKDHSPKQSISRAAIAPFEKQRSAIIKTAEGDFVGEIGEFRSSVRKNLKMPHFTAGFELDVNVLTKLSGGLRRYVQLPRFPKVEQDITLKVPSEVNYGELFGFMWRELNKDTTDKRFSSLGAVDIYQSEGDNEYKHVTMRLRMASYERTLTSEQVNTLLDKAALAAKDKFGAQRV